MCCLSYICSKRRPVESECDGVLLHCGQSALSIWKRMWMALTYKLHLFSIYPRCTIQKLVYLFFLLSCGNHPRFCLLLTREFSVCSRFNSITPHTAVSLTDKRYAFSSSGVTPLLRCSHFSLSHNTKLHQNHTPN